MRAFLAALILCLFLPSVSFAKHRHHHFSHHRTIRYAGEIVSHPAGCPRVSFCGCGVALKVFGHAVRSLWLAANWYRFPRSSPAAGNVAIFGRHHVAYIIAAHGDGTATLYDPNSGHHLTRIHRVSLRGAVVVAPRG